MGSNKHHPNPAQHTHNRRREHPNKGEVWKSSNASLQRPTTGSTWYIVTKEIVQSYKAV